jgi:hypothetical protein
MDKFNVLVCDDDRAIVDALEKYLMMEESFSFFLSFQVDLMLENDLK